MTDPAQQSREALGGQLREIRKDAGLTARVLAHALAWPPSTVSKLEHGHQTPVRLRPIAWCSSSIGC
ncbi:helix-turn-helix domain-containing protein [Nocardia sp. NPDC101769]|uniref:helix-turn-helix domain-containing protein n=1 Tax=Nocardia sp. NPDC101769 TaxID=3364333 RepID=UPI0038083ADD